MRPRRGIFYVGAEQHIASAGGGGIIQYNIIIIIRRNISAFLFNQKVLIHFFFFFFFPRKGAVAVHYTECIQRSTNGNGTHSYPQLDLMPILNNNTNRSMRMDWIKSLASRWSVRWISFKMTTLSIGLSKIWRRGIKLLFPRDSESECYKSDTQRGYFSSSAIRSSSTSNKTYWWGFRGKGLKHWTDRWWATMADENREINQLTARWAMHRMQYRPSSRRRRSRGWSIPIFH